MSRASSGGPGGHRARTRERTRTELRAVARRLLAEHGPEAVTLRAIGKELGLVPSGVYRYYPSREELLSAVAGDLYADLLARLTEAAGPLPPGPRALRALAAAYREWSLAHPAEFALLIAVPNARPPHRAADRAADQVADQAEGRADGQGQDGDAPGVRQSFITTLLRAAGPLLTRAGHPAPPASAAAELAVYRRLAADATGRPAADFEDGALYAAVVAWGMLQGQVALEALGQRPFPTADADAVFDGTVVSVLGGLTAV